MIADLQENPSIAKGLRADVLIAGGGPAGISLALELARNRPDWQIVLLEAGGEGDATPEERDLYKLAQGEMPYSVAELCRRRKLGGTTAHWGGWVKPPDAADYNANSRWELPGWPLGPEELAPYMSAACNWCELADENFDLRDIRRESDLNLLPFSQGGPLAEGLFRFSPPTRFGQRYLAALEEQENLLCLLHANLTGLEMREGNVAALRFAALGGETFTLEAGSYVLAMGGIESTRQLLNLRTQDTALGEGIDSPHLGRYFADHFGLSPGRLLAPADLNYHRSRSPSGPLMPVIGFSPQQLAKGENNCAIYLWAEAAEDSLLQGVGGQPGLGFKPGEYWHYHVKVIVEPRPYYHSTISLTEERDALGLRRAKLDWRIHPGDFDSAYRLVETLGLELAREGLGRLQIRRANSPEVRRDISGGCHHMGTIRMAATSADGVTDPNLRVYGTDNLYVASSAVFPRYGYSNPTLTTVALSVRLAQHLAGLSRGDANAAAA